jgi:RluA family pseudouridine synthase
VQRHRFKIPQKLHLGRFDRVTHELLNEKVVGGISKSLTRKLIMIGGAYLNGKRCRIASKQVYSGNEIQVEYDPARLGNVPAEGAAVTEHDILYNKDGLIVVNKPANLPTVPTLDNARDNLVAGLKRLLGKNQYIGIHHRLDAPTSGCVLFTLDEKMNAPVARLFQESLIHKEYVAICSAAKPPASAAWEVKNQIFRAERKRNRYTGIAPAAVDGKPPEGDFAFSRFELLASAGQLLLVRAEPVTGRTHQLRVHLAEGGYPILGDRTYAGPEAVRLMLHARRLNFRLGPDLEEVSVEAPIPAEFLRYFPS